MTAETTPFVGRVGRRLVETYCRRAVRREVELRVEGKGHVPRSGPAILVARHVHHLLDGCALVAALPRPVHIIVAVDWARPGRDRGLLEWGSVSLGLPAVIRPESEAAGDASETARLLRRATRQAVDLLRDGRLLVVFPEGYPNIDPKPTPKPDLDAWLPFRPGFVQLAALAARGGGGPVPIVPTGFRYEHGERTTWRVTLRFGEPLFLGADGDRATLAEEVEARVRSLSAADGDGADGRVAAASPD